MATVIKFDLVATVLVGAVTRLPMAVMVSLVFFRPLVLFLAFGSVLRLTTPFAAPSVARFAGACALFYLLLPLCLWALKPGAGSLFAVYRSPHTHADLFAVVCLPFLLACGISVYRASLRSHPTPERNA
ncbi:hypothetical protein ACFP2F_21585 [Hymenobacter artigasi]|uniref:Uncharacterized protein n=1 Tax=Hymenobacter artigasi TaxID=2719616 RepID=A0ABX1HNM2_9BACT|nr:hypothetical protein [Hymenobacter artigasi]NKI91863.1 hypothetical protein [Hymenobacter artigasi]